MGPHAEVLSTHTYPCPGPSHPHPPDSAISMSLTGGLF